MTISLARGTRACRWAWPQYVNLVSAVGTRGAEEMNHNIVPVIFILLVREGELCCTVHQIHGTGFREQIIVLNSD